MYLCIIHIHSSRCLFNTCLAFFFFSFLQKGNLSILSDLDNSDDKNLPSSLHSSTHSPLHSAHSHNKLPGDSDQHHIQADSKTGTRSSRKPRGSKTGQRFVKQMSVSPTKLNISGKNSTLNFVNKEKNLSSSPRDWAWVFRILVVCSYH